ncbi:PhrA family quorum-sensing system peptide [Tuanshanicoccus yangjingiae]|uniref:PhrA family quorum-sensing system peptide n=1 Tax=Aerococcaceae bacterium zg-252 TaxID=2796928 RepID=UPI0040645654
MRSKKWIQKILLIILLSTVTVSTATSYQSLAERGSDKISVLSQDNTSFLDVGKAD